MLNDVKALAKGIGVLVKFSESATEYIAKKSFDKVYGARPIRRTITSLIENPLSKKILAKEILPGQSILVDTNGEEITFKKV